MVGLESADVRSEGIEPRQSLAVRADIWREISLACCGHRGAIFWMICSRGGAGRLSVPSRKQPVASWRGFVGSPLVGRTSSCGSIPNATRCLCLLASRLPSTHSRRYSHFIPSASPLASTVQSSALFFIHRAVPTFIVIFGPLKPNPSRCSVPLRHPDALTSYTPRPAGSRSVSFLHSRRAMHRPFTFLNDLPLGRSPGFWAPKLRGYEGLQSVR